MKQGLSLSILTRAGDIRKWILKGAVLLHEVKVKPSFRGP